MFVVGKWNKDMDTNKNYLDMATKRFIFNKYKTQKKYGQQVVDLSDNEKMWTAITDYLKHTPLHKGKITKSTEFRFLCYEDGSPLTSVNAITRILNKCLGKKIGTSMLRHIFLSDKYDIKDMNETAEAMGHSVNEALKYAKE
jgi:integrase